MQFNNLSDLKPEAVVVIKSVLFGGQACIETCLIAHFPLTMLYIWTLADDIYCIKDSTTVKVNVTVKDYALEAASRDVPLHGDNVLMQRGPLLFRASRR